MPNTTNPDHHADLDTITDADLAQTTGGRFGCWQRPYTVQRGDTLTAIANRYHMPLDRLIGMNGQIRNPNLIYPGQQVNVGRRRWPFC